MKKLFMSALLALIIATPVLADSHGDKKMPPPSQPGMDMGAIVEQSIQRFKLAEDVTVEDAIDSMKLRANGLNFKMVADLPLSEQVKAMGEEANYMRILAFCDALIAKKMVEYNLIFAGFLPCRIAVVEDAEGQGWLLTMNMDMMLHAVELPDDLKPLAQQVRDNIYSIIDAGVNGDL